MKLCNPCPAPKPPAHAASLRGAAFHSYVIWRWEACFKVKLYARRSYNWANWGVGLRVCLRRKRCDC